MKRNILLLCIALVTLIACVNDEVAYEDPDYVSFLLPSVNIKENSTPIEIAFSTPAKRSGSVHIKLIETNVTYSSDYSTTPESHNNVLELGYSEGSTGLTFILNRFIPQSDEVKSLKMIIEMVSEPYRVSGNSSIVLNFNEGVLLGGAFAPNIGGPSQPRQVFIDLDRGESTEVLRTSWDLGFYSGDTYRVILNSTVKMSAKKLPTTDITLPVLPDSLMLIGQGAGNVSQIDAPDGDLNKTVIEAISDNEDENNVYLINLGSLPAETPPYIGSVATDTGGHRGWKKIRVLREPSGYRLQYASLQDTTYSEEFIAKDTAYNFSFFAFEPQTTVMVEPPKTKWDLSFTTFTTIVESTIPYFFSDFILTNIKGGASAYAVSVQEHTFTEFGIADVDMYKFSQDQTVIGASWRDTATNGSQGVPVSQFIVHTNIFYVIKDPEGNLYKLRMTQGVLESGERGHPKFIYSLLQ